MTPGQILLAASLAANMLVGWAYLGQRDATAVAETTLHDMRGQRDGAREAASTCSDAVDDLRTLADSRKKEADGARRAAAKRVENHNQRADAILAAPPAVPGDVCASAQVRVDEWLMGRAEP